MSLSWVWFLIALCAFTWASWLHTLLADRNTEVVRLEWDNANLRTDIDALNNPDLDLDATWDEDAHQAHQAELIERAHVEQWDREMES